jgi:MarR family transcriptional regulator, transcriptional regulator for hemolysin
MRVGWNDEECGPESFVAFWINRASRLILRRTDARLRPFGLAMSHLPVLRSLAGRRALSQTELARIAGVEQPSMAETVARMERDGVVQREQNPTDGRGTLIALTRRARARFPKAMEVLREGEREAVAGLSQSERTALRELLKRVTKNIEASIERAAQEGSHPSRRSNAQ